MENRSGFEQELVKKDSLAPIEHYLLGSTSVSMTIEEVENLLGRASQGEKAALKKLLVVTGNRDKEVEKIRKGILPFIEIDDLIDLFNRELNPCIRMKPVNEETGLVDAKWEIYLLDGKGEVVKDMETLNGLRLSHSYSSWFQFDKTSQEGYRVMEIKQKNK